MERVLDIIISFEVFQLEALRSLIDKLIANKKRMLQLKKELWDNTD